MTTDIRFFVKEHALTRDFPVCLIYGELYGPIISGEFAGSQMIRVCECPEWALTKYDSALVGRLVPTALIKHGFEYPAYDRDRNYRKFVVRIAFADAAPVPYFDADVIASADSFSDALEHAYAHARFKQKKATYVIVDSSRAIAKSLFDPEDAANSWVWGAAE
jgi:hypothetical protein